MNFSKLLRLLTGVGRPDLGFPLSDLPVLPGAVERGLPGPEGLPEPPGRPFPVGRPVPPSGFPKLPGAEVRGLPGPVGLLPEVLSVPAGFPGLEGRLPGLLLELPEAEERGLPAPEGLPGREGLLIFDLIPLWVYCFSTG